tara:strand:+ start:17372 stop:18283 length:912 start_codon:yes stop_codon:yes gene_type:complete
MTILITGANGFIGQAVAKIIPDRVCVVRSLENAVFENSICVNSIDSYTNWDGKLNNIKSIIHLAGIAHRNSVTEDEYLNVNCNGAVHLAREAQKYGVKRFVFVSSIGVCGDESNDSTFKPYDTPAPKNSYARSKLAAEHELTKVCKEIELDLVIVRPTLVYGPDAPGNFSLLTQLIRRVPLLPFGSIENRRSFISVHNLADLLFVTATHPSAAGHIFLAAEEKTISIRGFTNAIATGLGKRIIQVPVPAGVLYLLGRIFGFSNTIKQLTVNLEVDTSNIEKILGWKPPYRMEQVMALLSKEKT